MAAFDISEKNYINRELSWLEFNQRVMMQARDEGNPLFEQLKFLSIACSNLDEFFMVRVASLKDQVRAKYEQTDSTGLTPKQQLSAIARRTRVMCGKLYEIYGELLAKLEGKGISVIRGSMLDPGQAAYCEGYFESALYPVLTPLAIDRSHPFPLVLGRSLNIAVMLEDMKGDAAYATLQIPRNYPRLVSLAGGVFVPIEDIVRMNIGKLFSGYTVTGTAVYRITRSGDLSFDEDDAEDLLSEIKKSLKARRHGEIVRLETEDSISPKLLKYLVKNFGLEKKDIYEYPGPVSLLFLSKEICKLEGHEELKYRPFTPNMPQRLLAEESIFETIKKGDILLYHPFDSFEPVVRLLREAAEDENVLAIKQTLYRVSSGSPIIEALERATDNGKQVTALVELKARFDEEHNIEYGEELAKRGANVIYGVKDLKTHSKITMIVRREEGGGVKQYLHLGTGNYNDVTATLYTDYSLLTCSDVLGADATAFFNSITGFFQSPIMSKLVMAPYWMRETFCTLIKREKQRAKDGEGGYIFAKMNSLTDNGIIKELFKAAWAGVKIRLIVRGVCCLNPEAPEARGNIQVRSIVGRFLEHSRVYIFGEGAEADMYLASADWMNRNLDRRVELMFPILDPEIHARVRSDMELYWKDNVKALTLAGSGSYIAGGEERGDESTEDELMLFDPVPEETVIAADYEPVEDGARTETNAQEEQIKY